MSDDYLVGLFDGEGCITIGYTKKDRVYLKCSVEMSSPEAVEAFQARFGGYIYKRKLRGANQQTWQWTLSSMKCLPLLELVSSKGLVKRKIASLCLPVARSYIKKHMQTDVPSDVKDMRIETMRQVRALNGARNRFATVT